MILSVDKIPKKNFLLNHSNVKSKAKSKNKKQPFHNLNTYTFSIAKADCVEFNLLHKWIYIKVELP